MGFRRAEAAESRRGRVSGAAGVAVFALALSLSACGSSKSSDAGTTAAATPAAPAVSASDAAASASAKGVLTAFVSGVRNGDGAAACAELTPAEQKQFVANAVDVGLRLDKKSCAGVVKSFHAASGAKSAQLDGSLKIISIGPKFVTATWMWSNGAQQTVLLEKAGDSWLLTDANNDFPTAVLHLFE